MNREFAETVFKKSLEESVSFSEVLNFWAGSFAVLPGSAWYSGCPGADVPGRRNPLPFSEFGFGCCCFLHGVILQRSGSEWWWWFRSICRPSCRQRFKVSFKSRFGRFCSASAGLFYVLYSTLEQRGFCHSKLPHRRFGAFSNVGNCSSGTLCLKQLITFRGVSSLEFVQKDEIFFAR